MTRPARVLLLLLLLALGAGTAACGKDGSPDDRGGADGTPAANAGAGEEAGDPSAPEGLGREGKVTALRDWAVPEDGFSFENYTRAPTGVELTGRGMRQIFGDGVCRGPVEADGNCELKAAAEGWRKQVVDSMSGGHCFGMALLALRFYTGDVQLNPFGGETTSALQLVGNPALSEEIGWHFATQYTKEAEAAYQFLDPRRAVETLKQAYASGQGESFALGIFLRKGGGGHEITPYGIEELPGDKVRILVYDNNFPGRPRAVDVDLARNSWRYYATTNPDRPDALYDGEGQVNQLSIDPVGPIVTRHACPVCADDTAPTPPEPDPDPAPGPDDTPAIGTVTVSLGGTSKGTVVVRDARGRRAGVVGGREITEIPGSSVVRPRTGDLALRDVPPVVLLPGGRAYAATASDTGPGARLHMTGPGFAASLDGFSATGSARAELSTGGAGRTVRVRALGGDLGGQPTLSLGLDGRRADRQIDAALGTIGQGDGLTLRVDRSLRRLGVGGSLASPSLELRLTRLSPGRGADRSSERSLRSGTLELP